MRMSTKQVHRLTSKILYFIVAPLSHSLNSQTYFFYKNTYIFLNTEIRVQKKYKKDELLIENYDFPFPIFALLRFSAIFFSPQQAQQIQQKNNREAKAYPQFNNQIESIRSGLKIFHFILNFFHKEKEQSNIIQMQSHIIQK